MATNDINGTITIKDNGSAAAIGGVTGALNANTAAATTNTKASAAAGTQAQKTQTNFGAFGSTASLVAGQVGQFNAGLGRTIGVGAQALGSMQALSTLGLGPVGIALGVVSAATTLYVSLTKQADDATRNYNQALKANADSLGDVISQMQRENQLIAEKNRLLAGGGGLEEYAAEERRLQNRLRLSLEQNGVDSARFRADRDEINAQIMRARQLRAAIEAGGGEAEETTISIEEGRTLTGREARDELARLQGRDGSSSGPSAAERAKAAQQALEAKQAEVERQARESSVNSLMQGEGSGIEGIDTIESRSEAETQAAEDSERAREANYRIAEENREAHAERMKAIDESVFSAFEAGIRASIDAVLSGQKTMGQAAMGLVKQVAKALAIEAIIKGAKELAEGFSMLAGVYTAGLAPGHFIAAAKWGAVGVAAGLAGAAVGGVGGGGGGGASAAPATASVGGGPASGAGSQQGGDTYNITVGSSGLVYAADRVQLFSDIDAGIQEARSRRGRSA